MLRWDCCHARSRLRKAVRRCRRSTSWPTWRLIARSLRVETDTGFGVRSMSFVDWHLLLGFKSGDTGRWRGLRKWHPASTWFAEPHKWQYTRNEKNCTRATRFAAFCPGRRKCPLLKAWIGCPRGGAVRFSATGCGEHITGKPSGSFHTASRSAGITCQRFHLIIFGAMPRFKLPFLKRCLFLPSWCGIFRAVPVLAYIFVPARSHAGPLHFRRLRIFNMLFFGHFLLASATPEHFGVPLTC